MKVCYAIAAGWFVVSASGAVSAQVTDLVATSRAGLNAYDPTEGANRVLQNAAPKVRECHDWPGVALDKESPDQIRTVQVCSEGGARARAGESIQIAMVSPGGYAGLTRLDVGNEAFIIAQLRSATLEFGNRVALDMIGDSLINLHIGRDALDAASLKGMVQSDSSLIIPARSVNALLDTVLNTEGVLRADSLAGINGSIYLAGGSPSQTGSMVVALADNSALPGMTASVTRQIILGPATPVPPMDYVAPPFNLPPVANATTVGAASGVVGPWNVVSPLLIVPPVVNPVLAPGLPYGGNVLGTIPGGLPVPAAGLSLGGNVSGTLPAGAPGPAAGLPPGGNVSGTLPAGIPPVASLPPGNGGLHRGPQGNNGFGNGGRDGVPGRSGKQDITR